MEDKEESEEKIHPDHMTSHVIPNDSLNDEDSSKEAPILSAGAEKVSVNDENERDDSQSENDEEEDHKDEIRNQDQFVFKDQVICFLDDNSDDNDDFEEEEEKTEDGRNVDHIVEDEEHSLNERGIQKLPSSMDHGVFENDIKFLSDAISTIHDISCHVDNIMISKEFLPEKPESTAENNCVFNILPREIILKIFSYLTTYELCVSVLPVCRTWYVIGYDPSLWQELDFIKCPNLPSIDLCRTIKRACHIKKLRLVGRNENMMSEPEVVLYTLFLKHLRKVDLGFCDGLTIRMLESFVTNCPLLDSLNVEGCPHVNDKAVEVIARKPDWKVLNFSHCNITDTGIQLLAKALTSLEYLNIDGISWIQDRTIGILVDYQGEHIKQLELDGAELTDASIQHIARCPQLSMLMISFCDNLTDQSLRLLQQTHSLTHLMLRKGANFSSGALLSLFQSPSLQNLTKLNLSECIKVVDETVIAIMKCCGSKLRELSLCWCWHVTDMGLISIVDHCRYVWYVTKTELIYIVDHYRYVFLSPQTEMSTDLPVLRQLCLAPPDVCVEPPFCDVIGVYEGLAVFDVTWSNI
ncbi:hypothetical protein FSP39_002152 [Pinctada imbricata]|uniref:F-box domain-containing protein n=1 Tax=Pinctada imbricata TaxID=66713 RepID=A0AA89BNA4_PINIB|nr:hypothetical protein FSP39_002152 [Pinctada imbricata]